MTLDASGLSPAPKAPPGLLVNVQVLRGLAAMLVVFVHLQDLAVLGGARPDVFVWGNTGVDLFFVISGLIMVQTTSRRPVTPLGFLGHRLARVAPLYWLVTLAVFALVMVAPSLLQSTDADPVRLAKSLAFIPYARPDGAMHPVVFLGWTLNYEMAFYLLFALGLAAPVRWLGLALPIALLAGVVAAGQAFPPANPVLAFYAAPIVLEFAAGMVLGAVLLRLPETRRAGQIALTLAAGAFALMIAGPLVAPQVDRAVIAGIPATVIVGAAVIAERGGIAVGLPFLRLIGDASYSLYLTHFFVTAAVAKLAARLGLTSPAALVGLGALALLLVIAVALATHVLVEKPLTRLFRARTAPPGPPIGAAPQHTA